MTAEFEEKVLTLVESNAAAATRHVRRLEELAEMQATFAKRFHEFADTLSRFVDETRERLDELEAWRERGY